MLSNAYFLAKFRFDTAENEPAKNLQNFREMHFRKMHFRKTANAQVSGARRRGDALPKPLLAEEGVVPAQHVEHTDLGGVSPKEATANLRNGTKNWNVECRAVQKVLQACRSRKMNIIL